MAPQSWLGVSAFIASILAAVVLPIAGLAASADEAPAPATAGKATQDLPGAVGRRCAWCRARRRDQGARGIPRTDRLHRRHQHGRIGRRRLRVGHERCRTWRRSTPASPSRSCSRKGHRARNKRCAARPTTTATTSARRSAPVRGRPSWARAWSPACSSRRCCASCRACRATTGSMTCRFPYRAVATDLVTGKAVVFSEGELANVMRASMSVPGAVAPAEYNGMILVDGMLTSNLPVDAARAMGADIVIAVNVGTPLLKRERAQFDPGCGRADAQHPDRAERAGLAGVAQADRHPDLARTRRLLDRRLRQPAQDHAAGRRGGAQGGRPAGAAVAAAGRIRRAAPAPTGGDGAGPQAGRRDPVQPARPCQPGGGARQ